jgi:hypothetical protein
MVISTELYNIVESRLLLNVIYEQKERKKENYHHLSFLAHLTQRVM